MEPPGDAPGDARKALRAYQQKLRRHKQSACRKEEKLKEESSGGSKAFRGIQLLFSWMVDWLVGSWND